MQNNQHRYTHKGKQYVVSWSLPNLPIPPETMLFEIGQDGEIIWTELAYQPGYLAEREHKAWLVEVLGE